MTMVSWYACVLMIFILAPLTLLPLIAVACMVVSLHMWLYLTG